MRFSLLVGAVIAAGCSSTPKVVSLPSGTFLATGMASATGGGTKGARNMALQMAARHCSKDGKRAEVIELMSADSGVHGVGATDVEFRCVPRT